MSVSVIMAVLLAGFAVGLRTFTGPAVIAWAAYLGCINLNSTPLSFMSSPVAVVVLSLAAFGEYVFDLLPTAPPRTAAVGLTARFISGAFSAACLLAASGQNLALCIFGGLAAIGGAFAGYQTRVRCVAIFKVNDPYIAIPEDIVAIVIALAAVWIVQ